jgi:hypothetical protein
MIDPVGMRRRRRTCLCELQPTAKMARKQASKQFPTKNRVEPCKLVSLCVKKKVREIV